MKLHEEKALVNRAQELGGALFKIRNAFIVWRQLLIMRNEKVTDNEFAAESQELINFHKGFFIPVILSVEHYFNVELYTLLMEIDGKSMPGLIKSLKGRGHDYVNEYAKFKNDHEEAIEQIGRCRNKIFAHKDKSAQGTKFILPSIKEYEQIFQDLQEFFNGMTSKALGQEFWFFDDAELESYRDTNLLMANLLRGESARKAEIQANYRDEMLNHYSSKKLNIDD